MRHSRRTAPRPPPLAVPRLSGRLGVVSISPSRSWGQPSTPAPGCQTFSGSKGPSSLAIAIWLGPSSRNPGQSSPPGPRRPARGGGGPGLRGGERPPAGGGRDGVGGGHGRRRWQGGGGQGGGRDRPGGRGVDQGRPGPAAAGQAAG